MPVQTGFPWTTFTINVTGSAVLALLPGIGSVRRRPALAAGLGSGLCGGYTTLSAYSEETRALLADGRLLVAATYVVATLVACLVAVALVDRLSSTPEQRAFEDEGGDE